MPSWRALALVAVLAVTACGAGDAPRARSVPARSVELAGGRLLAESATTGVSGVVHDLVASGDVLVALVSTADSTSADIALRSEDAGATWTEIATGLGDAIDGSGANDWSVVPLHPELHLAGDWLVATRTIGDDNGPTGQAVAVSVDLGATWRLVDVPAPDDRLAFVNSAVADGDRLVLAGTVQSTLPPMVPSENSGDVNFEERIAAYDAAVWRMDASDASVERVTGEPFDDQPARQVLHNVVAFDGRLIAIGGDSRAATTQQCCFVSTGLAAWESADGGRTWSPEGGFPPAEHTHVGGLRPPDLESGELLVGDRVGRRFALAPGQHSWSEVEDVAELPDGSGRLELGAGRLAVTWVDNVACDCAVAHAGVVVDGNRRGAPLAFHECRDESVRGETHVHAPVEVGDVVAALAWCNDRDRNAASLAWSTDGAATWSTERLRVLANDGEDLFAGSTFTGRRFVLTADELVLLLATDDVDATGDTWSNAPHAITAVRIRPS